MIPVPPRVQQLTLAVQQDREQAATLIEQIAAAVQAEAEAKADAEEVAEKARQMLADAQERCDAARDLVRVRRNEHQALAEEIAVSEVMLEAASEILTPAEPTAADTNPEVPCPGQGCGRALVQSPRGWVHVDDSKAACDPAQTGAHRVAEEVSHVDA